MGRITIFVKKNCKYCDKVKGVLRNVIENVQPELEALPVNYGIEIVTFDVGKDLARSTQCVKLARTHTVPQVFFNDEHVGGASTAEVFQKCGELRRRLILLAQTPHADFPPPPDATVIKVNDQIAFSSQPTASQISNLRSFGFKSLLNLVHVDEPGAVCTEKPLAQATGLQYFHVPPSSPPKISISHIEVDLVPHFTSCSGKHNYGTSSKPDTSQSPTRSLDHENPNNSTMSLYSDRASSQDNVREVTPSTEPSNRQEDQEEPTMLQYSGNVIEGDDTSGNVDTISEREYHKHLNQKSDVTGSNSSGIRSRNSSGSDFDAGAAISSVDPPQTEVTGYGTARYTAAEATSQNDITSNSCVSTPLNNTSKSEAKSITCTDCSGTFTAPSHVDCDQITETISLQRKTSMSSSVSSVTDQCDRLSTSAPTVSTGRWCVGSCRRGSGYISQSYCQNLVGRDDSCTRLRSKDSTRCASLQRFHSADHMDQNRFCKEKDYTERMYGLNSQLNSAVTQTSYYHCDVALCNVRLPAPPPCVGSPIPNSVPEDVSVLKSMASLKLGEEYNSSQYPTPNTTHERTMNAEENPKDVSKVSAAFFLREQEIHTYNRPIQSSSPSSQSTYPPSRLKQLGGDSYFEQTDHVIIQQTPDRNQRRRRVSLESPTRTSYNTQTTSDELQINSQRKRSNSNYLGHQSESVSSSTYFNHPRDYSKEHILNRSDRISHLNHGHLHEPKQGSTENSSVPMCVSSSEHSNHSSSPRHISPGSINTSNTTEKLPILHTSDTTKQSSMTHCQDDIGFTRQHANVDKSTVPELSRSANSAPAGATGNHHVRLSSDTKPLNLPFSARHSGSLHTSQHSKQSEKSDILETCPNYDYTLTGRHTLDATEESVPSPLSSCDLSPVESRQDDEEQQHSNDITKVQPPSNCKDYVDADTRPSGDDQRENRRAVLAQSLERNRREFSGHAEQSAAIEQLYRTTNSDGTRREERLNGSTSNNVDKTNHNSNENMRNGGKQSRGPLSRMTRSTAVSGITGLSAASHVWPMCAEDLGGRDPDDDCWNSEWAVQVLRTIHEAPKPILLHCAVGVAACAMSLIAAGEEHNASPDQIHAWGKALGHDFAEHPDLSRVIESIDALLKQSKNEA